MILDITDASKPSEIGKVTTPSIVNGVAVSGNYAYVGDGLSGLIIIDISNPSLSKIAGSCNNTIT